MMHVEEVVVLCQGLISGLLMTPGGSGLEGLRPRTLHLQGLEGCADPGTYCSAREVKLGNSVCLQWPNMHLISLCAHLFSHHPPLSVLS